MTTTPNQYEALKLKRNQLRDRMKALKSELEQCALTLRYVERQFKEMNAPVVRTPLRTALQRALASHPRI